MGSNPERNVRVAVIGCGFFATNHLNAWRDLRNDGVELVAVCDSDSKRAEAAARTFGVEHHYTDADRMLTEAKPDLVDIVTQVDTHRMLAEMAINAAPGVIVQKPFAPTLEDCMAIVDHAEKRGVFLAVHENFRFQLPKRRVKALLDEGLIGEPTWSRISFRTSYDVYAGQPYLRDEERFIVTDVGTHVLDLARFYLGEVAAVSAELQNRNADIRGEDTATILLRHASDAVSVVECTYSARRKPDLFPQTLLEIEGTGGSMMLLPDYRINVQSNEYGDQSFVAEPEVLPWAAKPWHVVQDSVLATCRHIANRFRSGQPADVSGADNAKTYALVEATYIAARDGRTVPPKI